MMMVMIVVITVVVVAVTRIREGSTTGERYMATRLVGVNEPIRPRVLLCRLLPKRFEW